MAGRKNCQTWLDLLYWLRSAVVNEIGEATGAENGPMNPNNISKIDSPVVKLALSVLEPTWARFRAENALRMHFHRSGIVFLLILEGFLINFD